MRTLKKRVGYQKYLDYDSMSMIVVPKYKYEINLSTIIKLFVSLLTNSKFYYSLVFPIITYFFVIISHNKAQIFVFSALFGLSLVPLITTFKEVLKSFFYAS